MDIPFIEIPSDIRRVIKFLVDRKDKVTFISECFSCALPEAAIFRHPNIIDPFPSDLSNEELKRELESCLEKCKNEFEAYCEFSVKLKQHLSKIEECLSSELDIVYHNYKDIAEFLNHSVFEHLMLKYIVLLEKLRDKVSFDLYSVQYPLLQQVELHKQFKFNINPDNEKDLKADFLTTYKNLSFEIDNYDICRFIGNFLSTLEVLPNIVAGRRLKFWEINVITNKAIMKKPISLKDFLEKFCGIEKKKSDKLRAISQRINQANKRNQIKLPEPVNVETKGSKKIFYYNPADLLKKWKEIMEKVSFLPELI